LNSFALSPAERHPVTERIFLLRVAALSECWSHRQAGNRKQVGKPILSSSESLLVRKGAGDEPWLPCSSPDQKSAHPVRLVRELNPTSQRAELNREETLTDRESDILRLMTGGYSNREIAEALDLSEGTVKNHVSNILSTLGVRDRTRAVLKAIQQGYL
jgi:DNA-binding NarL/FixJ family response regulator